jgi:hypothetical protein
VRFFAGQGELQPPQPLAVGDHADLLVLGLEDRALLDVILEVGVHLPRANLLVADPADALQLVAEGFTLRVLAAVGVVQRMDAGEDAGRHHRRGEAGALLVGPVDHDDRPARLDAELVEGAHQLQTGKHAQYAVVATAGRLGVEVTADVDRIEVRLCAFAAGEHGAHLVKAHSEASVLAPLLV